MHNLCPTKPSSLTLRTPTVAAVPERGVELKIAKYSLRAYEPAVAGQVTHSADFPLHASELSKPTHVSIVSSFEIAPAQDTCGHRPRLVPQEPRHSLRPSKPGPEAGGSDRP